MSAIRREKPAYGIAWTEISLLGKSNQGMGHFVTKIEPEALASRALVATVAYAGSVSVGVGVHTIEQEVVVLLGGEARHSRRVYKLPNPLATLDDGYELEVAFANWEITNVLLNSLELMEDGDGRG